MTLGEFDRYINIDGGCFRSIDTHECLCHEIETDLRLLGIIDVSS